MATPQLPNLKRLAYTICFIAVVALVYQRNIGSAGSDAAEKSYFESQEKGAATVPFTFPVYIVTGVNNDTRTTTKQDNATYRLPGEIRCETDKELCDKIKFIGKFSDTDKRKYQSLIIRQIKKIDEILDTDVKISEKLFSITLDRAKGTRRGYAGNATIMIYLGNIPNQEELAEIITHELGHIVDLGVLQGSRRTIQHNYTNIDNTYFGADDISLKFYTLSWLNNTTRKADAGAMDFVGGYAMNDPFEDFAETFNMYLNHHNVFALLSTSNSLLKKKYSYMEKLFNKHFLNADIATTISIKDNLESRPWDTTKGY